MFEYLMPVLVVREPEGSLLAQTDRLVVARQQAYGRERGVPWGISESAFNARDLEFTYQYSNFGVPGLGLKRGLASNLVIAPYATGLAAMLDPPGACENFARLADLGAVGRYGFYEALDFTKARVPDGARVAIVRNFMAHHQGMTIVAIANVLQDGRMRARFHREPMIRAVDLLLHERMPRDVAVAHPRAEEVKLAAGGARSGPTADAPVRRAAAGRTGDAADVERALRGDADRLRWRLQPLGRDRRDPLARGRHPRRQRVVRLSQRHRERGGLVGDAASGGGGGRSRRGAILRGPGRVHPPRRGADDGARRAGLGRG